MSSTGMDLHFSMKFEDFALILVCDLRFSLVKKKKKCNFFQFAYVLAMRLMLAC